MKHIVSRENPHFKALRKCCLSSRERRKTGRVVLDGIHLIESYMAHFGGVEQLLVSASGLEKSEISALLAKEIFGHVTTTLEDNLFNELAAVESPSGIMAVVSRPICRAAVNLELDAVVLDGIQDPGNLGSILRSVAASGFRQVMLSTDCAQVWSPKTLRSAMGAHFQLDLHESCDLVGFLEAYRGVAVLTALDASTSLFELDLAKPVAWVFGNEGQGVRANVAEPVALRVRIPMPGETESLNVAAAAAVCLFETVRQRQH